MPTCVIAVTTPRSEVADCNKFLKEASQFIAGQLGKPEGYVTIRLELDQIMCHGGSTDPCGSVILYSIGALGSKNRSHAKEIAKFVSDKLKIPQDRFEAQWKKTMLNFVLPARTGMQLHVLLYLRRCEAT